MNERQWFRKFNPHRYITAHPESKIGDANVADRMGYDTITFLVRPGHPAGGLLLLRLKPWWRRLFR